MKQNPNRIAIHHWCILTLFSLFFGASAFSQTVTQPVSYPKDATSNLVLNVAMSSPETAKLICSYLTENYPQRILSATADVPAQKLMITYTSELELVDILQIFLQYGCRASYDEAGKRYSLDSDGVTLLSEDIKQ